MAPQPSEISVVKPSVGLLLTHTFKLWTSSFKKLLPLILAIVAINALPSFIKTVERIDSGSPTDNWIFLFSILIIIPQIVVTAAVIFINYDYAIKIKTDYTIFYALSVGLSRLLSMTGVTLLLVLICVAIGLIPGILISFILAVSSSIPIIIICIFVGIAGAIPIVFFCVRWSLANPVIVIEEQKAMQSVKRSIELVKGKFFLVLEFFIILFSITTASSFGPYFLLKSLFAEAQISPLIEAVVRFVAILPFHVFCVGIADAGFVVIYCALKPSQT